MPILFRVLLLLYVAVIFLLTDSSAAKVLASYNHYSLLHVPLYGIMSLLLFLSMTPVKFSQSPRGNISIRANRNDLKRSCFIAGLIALGVAVADEYYQSYIPIRSASASDVFLDLVGISLSLVLILRFFKRYSPEGSHER